MEFYHDQIITYILYDDNIYSTINSQIWTNIGIQSQAINKIIITQLCIGNQLNVTEFEPTITQFVNERSTIQLNWPNKTIYKLSDYGFEPCCCHLNFRYIAPVSSKEFLDIQATTECRFTLKRVRDMIIITYSYSSVLL